MSAPKYNVKTLPKWAQNEIDHIEMRLLEARKRIDELTNSEPTRIELDPYHTEAPCSYLPNRSRIRFALDDKQREWIEVSLRDDRVEVYASDTLAIAPAASNVIHLRLRNQS